MIELELETTEIGFENAFLLIDGIRQNYANLRPRDEGFELFVLDDALINKLMRHSISDFPPSINMIHLYTNLRLIEGEQHISQHLIILKEAAHSRIAFHFLFDVENWK